MFVNESIILINKESSSFLYIEKGGNTYGITSNTSFRFNFLALVIDMLEKHGDVFAAYVNSIDPTLTREQKEDLIYKFPENIKQCKIQVVSAHGTATYYKPTHNWKHHKVLLW